MTREEIIRNLKYTMEKHKNDTVNTFETNISLMCKDILDYLEQQPCDDAQERYEDLCEYFGGAKDILKSRKDFKAWLERIKWHIRKAEELYEKYENKQEPCDNAISREDTLKAIIENLGIRSKEYLLEAEKAVYKTVENMPPVTPQQKHGRWIFVDEAKEHAHCSECDYGNVDLFDGRPHNYCSNCGRRMVEPQEGEEQTE